MGSIDLSFGGGVCRNCPTAASLGGNFSTLRFTARVPREAALDPENLARAYKSQVSMLASMGKMTMFLMPPPPAVAATAEFTRDTGVATVASFECCGE